jgi:hypothetical protein
LGAMADLRILLTTRYSKPYLCTRFADQQDFFFLDLLHIRKRPNLLEVTVRGSST